MKKRKFITHGYTDNNTSISVTINDNTTVCRHFAHRQIQPVLSELFCFYTHPETHGWTNVNITVVRGKVVLNRTHVVFENYVHCSGKVGSIWITQDYVAAYNGSVRTGAVLNDVEIGSTSRLELQTGDRLSYSHLHLQGPRSIDISLSDSHQAEFESGEVISAIKAKTIKWNMAPLNYEHTSLEVDRIRQIIQKQRRTFNANSPYTTSVVSQTASV